MDALSPEEIRRREAQQALNDLLDSEVAYKFMAGAADFMTKEGLEKLKDAARKGQRWAFRLLIDAMKVLAKLEIAKATATGRQQGPPIKVKTRFARDGEKI